MKKLLAVLSRPENVIGGAAIVLSVCALGVSFYEARLMRAQQSASVWPYLELSRSYFTTTPNAAQGEDGWQLYFNAQNSGVGPAKVRAFELRVDGTLYPTWGDALIALLDVDAAPVYGQSSINGRVVPTGESIRMFETHDPVIARALYEAGDAGRIDFNACYCSVFDECWRTSYSGFGQSEPVRSCPQTPPDRAFQE